MILSQSSSLNKCKMNPAGNDVVDNNKETKRHYNYFFYWFGYFTTGSVITVSSDLRWHSASWQFLKPANTINPKISISNWQTDGLMEYKMIHPSQGLNGVKERTCLFIEHSPQCNWMQQSCLYFDCSENPISAKNIAVTNWINWICINLAEMNWTDTFASLWRYSTSR